MNPMKRLGLAALLAVGVTLLASTPTRAGYWADWGTIELLNTGDEPEASGEASLTHVGDVHVKGVKGFSVTEGRLEVRCRNLTPGATYWTPAGTFTANSNGDASARATVVIGWHYYADGSRAWAECGADVYRINPDGSSTPVLTGGFLWW